MDDQQDDQQVFQEVYREVYQAQVQPVRTVDVGSSTESTQAIPTTEPPTEPPRSTRWGQRGNKSVSTKSNPMDSMRGKALRVQAPLLAEWRSFAVVGGILFVPTAKVIGTNDPFVWIGYATAGGMASLSLMWVGVTQEKARLGILSWKLAVMFLLMPPVTYGIAYGLTSLLAYSGLRF